MRQVQALETYKTVLHSGTARLLRLIAWQLIPKWLISSGLPGSAWRILLLRIFGAEIGRLCRFKSGLNVSCPWNLKVGDFCCLGESVWIDSLACVEVGNRVCISQGSYLCTGNHDYKKPTFDLRLGPILIEAEAWIVQNRFFLPHPSSQGLCSLHWICCQWISSSILHSSWQPCCFSRTPLIDLKASPVY